VTPRGGGSGLAGGAAPLYGGIVLDLARMNHILHFDVKAKYMVVEPAVRTIDIQNIAKKYGLLYAGDPCSSDDCVIAGNVATNAGGNRAIKYGVTADQVYELEIVTPSGDVVNLGGRLKKNSTGYGLVKLIAGSEGTLGIITKVMLKLENLAPFMPTFLVVMPSLYSAVNLVSALLEADGIDPISLELIDRKTILDMENYWQKRIFAEGRVGDCLMVQVEAYDEKEAAKKYDQLQKICVRHDSLTISKAEDDDIWQARRQWGKAIDAKQPVGAVEDLVLPVDQIADFLHVLEKTAAEFNLEFRIAGHAGDGNMHVRLLPGSMALTEWPEALQRFREKLYPKVYELGGRLSGEHGVGLKRKDFFTHLIDPVEMKLMQAVKLAFDPNLILNPGKIFDVDDKDSVLQSEKRGEVV
jgi:glycolate oxidase